MIVHCMKCDINWASLWSQESGNESVEVCPQCLSDMDLEDGTDIVAFIKCPISGRITEVGGMSVIEMAHPIVIRPRRVIVWEETWEEFKDRQDKAQYDMINRYSDLLGSMLPAEAYNKACREMEKVERKYHYEETSI